MHGIATVKRGVPATLTMGTVVVSHLELTESAPAMGARTFQGKAKLVVVAFDGSCYAVPGAPRRRRAGGFTQP